MNLVLVSTSNAAGGRSDALDRMLGSVANTAAGRPDLSIVLLLLLQKCAPDLVAARSFPAFVDISSIPHQTSLSAARNILLSRALSRGFVGSTTVVGFPDDDCWYPPGLLDRVVEEFAQAPGLDLWFCRYSSNPVGAKGVGIASRPARARDVVRHASSNTMFVRGRLIQSGASFDEKLGVGTPAGGAEDTEFALRAHLAGRQSVFFDAAAVGHRDKNPQLRAKYYRGGLLAVSRHARQHRGIATELVRKIAVGGWLALRRELSFGEFLGALSAAFSAWRDGTPKPEREF